MQEEVQEQTESAPAAETEQAEQTYNIDGQEIPLSEFQDLAQKGMFMGTENFNRKLEEIKLATFGEMAAEHGLTPEEFQESFRKKSELEESLAPIKAENQKYRDSQQAEEEKAKQQEDFNQFNEYFNEINGRNFDAKRDELPPEVLEAVLKQDIPLPYAYIQYINNDLRQQIKEMTATKQEKSKPKQRIDDIFLRGFESF